MKKCFSPTTLTPSATTLSRSRERGTWPVAGTLMVEPTESESKYELDRFCDAVISIHAERTAVETGAADAKNNLLKNAPNTADQIASDNWNNPYTREGASRTGMRRFRPRACTTTNSGRTSPAWTTCMAIEIQ